MKTTNDRCPLQAECERKCKFQNRELECDYYHANARPDYEIADQEAKRWSSDKLTFDMDDDEDWDDDEDLDEEEELAPRPINGLMCKLPVDKLVPHPDNPRKDLGDVTELAASIKAKGVLQNLTVVEAGDGTYRIIIGHRRHAAAKLAGLTKLPCVIADMTPKEQFETMMVENVQRSALTVYEEAEGFQMMLDMGGSVEEVAKATGFSETTVRRRVSLLKLDKGEFQKAETRGGTMTDYLKLNAIQDPDRRNKVLTTIGTPEFNYYLKNAIEDQEFAVKFAEALKVVQEADWIKEKTNEDTSYYGPWSSVRYFDKHNQGPITTPKDTASYIYSVEGNIRIYIYRKISEGERSTIDNLKDRCRAQASQIAKELGSITKMHREMREEFMMQFATFNNAQMDIEAFAAKALLAYSYGTISNLELLSKISGVPIVKKGNLKVLDAEIWNKMLHNWPQKALLSATYARMERAGNCYHNTKYYDKMGCSVPNYEKCEALDLLYEGLVSLGYEMCEDEKLMQSGKHPLFKQAKDLIATFKKEVKENG